VKWKEEKCRGRDNIWETWRGKEKEKEGRKKLTFAEKE